ncbi:MAG: ABC transporter ATP-binding protein [Candidatus Eisenbacteria bacterium]
MKGRGAALRVEGVSKRYPLRRSLGASVRRPFRKETIRALHQVRFDLRGGEIVALLGPNGSGKSTLLKILASLVLPTEGIAFIRGRDVERHSLETRAHIGICMSEERSFYYRLTGRQNLRFFGRLLGVPRARLEEEIDDGADLLGIGEIDDRFMTYSTGTRQKLGVARSLLGARPVLLLDEPTRGLDPYTASRFLGRLRRLAGEEGRAILLASHDLGAVEKVADRLLFLHKGELLADGPPDEVLDRFHIPREIEVEFAEHRPGWKGALETLAGVLEVVVSGDDEARGRGRVRVDERSFDLSAFLPALLDRCGPVRRLEVRRGSLEELYKRYAGGDE